MRVCRGFDLEPSDSQSTGPRYGPKRVLARGVSQVVRSHRSASVALVAIPLDMRDSAIGCLSLGSRVRSALGPSEPRPPGIAGHGWDAPVGARRRGQRCGVGSTVTVSGGAIQFQTDLARPPDGFPLRETVPVRRDQVVADSLGVIAGPVDLARVVPQGLDPISHVRCVATGSEPQFHAVAGDHRTDLRAQLLAGVRLGTVPVADALN